MTPVLIGGVTCVVVRALPSATFLGDVVPLADDVRFRDAHIDDGGLLAQELFDDIGTRRDDRPHPAPDRRLPDGPSRG
jgi:hypothetical protein